MPRCGTGDRVLVLCVPSAVSVGPQRNVQLLQLPRSLCLCPSGDGGAAAAGEEGETGIHRIPICLFVIRFHLLFMCSVLHGPTTTTTTSNSTSSTSPVSGCPGGSVRRCSSDSRCFSPFGLTLGSNSTDAPLTKRPFQWLPPPLPPGAALGWAMKVHLEHITRHQEPQSSYCLRWFNYRSLCAF